MASKNEKGQTAAAICKERLADIGALLDQIGQELDARFKPLEEAGVDWADAAIFGQDSGRLIGNPSNDLPVFAGRNRGHFDGASGLTPRSSHGGLTMTDKEVEEGIKALFDEALAVALGEIDEGDMTMPTELESLIRVSTFEEEGLLSVQPGIVLRFKGSAEFQIGIVRSR